MIPMEKIITSITRFSKICNISTQNLVVINSCLFGLKVYHEENLTRYKKINQLLLDSKVMTLEENLFYHHFPGPATKTAYSIQSDHLSNHIHKDNQMDLADYIRLCVCLTIIKKKKPST